MRRQPALSSAGLLFLTLAVTPAGQAASPPRVHRLDPGLDSLIAENAQIEEIASGFQWLEGPLWDSRQGRLLFSDIPANSIFQWQPENRLRLFLKPSGYDGEQPFSGREPGSNGLLFDGDHRLVICQHGNRRIARLEAGGTMTVLVDSYLGKRLNSPNDGVFAANGDLYFTDPPFGLPRGFDDPGKELDFCGVFRLSSGGDLKLLTRELKAPNGVALSPDGKTLYVTDVDSRRPAWYAFSLQADGSLGSRRLLHVATELARVRPGGPDGLKVDRDGNLFAAGPGGLYVFTPDGRLLGWVETAVATSNCAWGEDGSVLFITAGSSLYRVPTRTTGWMF